jgi:predicted RNA binding protein YcfA (HicA-like mRNA interferase family)
MTKSVTFGELECALQEFGYERRKKANHVVFQHPNSELMIVLPQTTPKSAVSSLHLRIVERTIRDDGVVDWGDVDFYMEHGKRKEKTIKKGDRLLWKIPGTGREIKVVAAAGEQDDLVIIRQNGSFSPCPVNQLRRDEAPES